MSGYYEKMTFKKQLMSILLIIGMVAVLVISIFLYWFETERAEKNTVYLINNTTKQTATMFSNRLEIVLNQYNKLQNSSSLWRFINSEYEYYDDYQKYDDMVNIYNNMKDIYSTNSEIIDSIYIQNAEGKAIQAYDGMVYDKEKVDFNAYQYDNLTDNYGYIWQNEHVDTIFKTNIDRNVVSIVQKLRNSKQEEKGIIILNLKGQYFKHLLSQVQISPNAYVMLMSQDGQMQADQVSEEYQLSQNDIKEIFDNRMTDDFKFNSDGTGKTTEVSYAKLDVNNWYVVSVVPYNDLVSSSQQLARILVVVVVVILIGLTFISVGIASLITKPIEQLTRQVVAFETDQNVDFSVSSGYEIATLAKGLSHLKYSVQRLLGQVKEEQEQKARLKLMILQAQIQPHFLYNTLASINQLIVMDENEKAGKMCDALSKFYRLGLSKGKDIICVQEEMEHIENYLFIQKYRYEKVFEYSINMSEQILKFDILKLSLQPLVENAIYHGIKKKEEGGTIVISGYVKDENMVIEVFDDGLGIPEDKLRQINVSLENQDNNSDGYGIYNVNGRLKIFFGEDAKLVYDSCEGIYTQAKIVIPLSRCMGVGICTDC